MLNALSKLSGKLANPIVVPANSVFQSGSINSGDTLTPATMANGTLLGNSSGSDAAATPQTVDGTLSLDGDALGLAKQAPGTLLGNTGSVAAQPGAIGIGTGLTVTPGTPPVLSVVPGGGSTTPDLTGAQVLSWWRSG